MNDADFKLLQTEAFAEALTNHNAALTDAVLRIQNDLSMMLEKLNRIEESFMAPPSNWVDEDDEDINDPPF